MLTLFSDATTKPMLGCISKSVVTVAAALSAIPIPLGIMALVDATISVIASATGKLRLTCSERMVNNNHSLVMLRQVMLIWTKYKLKKCTFDMFVCKARYMPERNIAADKASDKTV